MRTLRAVAVISFRYKAICNLQTHDQEKAYNEVARGISKGRLAGLPEILQALREVYPDDARFKAWAHTEDSKLDRLIYRLGNMTPLETGTNRDLGNQDYAVKRAACKDRDFRITRAAAEHYDEWSETKIAARQAQLAKAATTIWRIDFNGSAG